MDFIGFFPGPGAGPPVALSRAAGALVGALSGASTQTTTAGGANLVTVTAQGTEPSFYCREDRLLAMKGLILDPTEPAARPSNDAV